MIKITILILMMHKINDLPNLCSGCCDRVSVRYKEKNEAYERHSYIYTSYVIEKDKINGRNHYTSEDGKSAIAYICNKWNIQSGQSRYKFSYA